MLNNIFLDALFTRLLFWSKVKPFIKKDQPFQKAAFLVQKAALFDMASLFEKAALFKLYFKV